MFFPDLIIRAYAKYINKKNKLWINNPLDAQQKTFELLIKNGRKTVYGKKHQFEKIQNYNDFKNSIPIVEYEDIKPFISLIRKGEKNILWPGKPIYLCKTSGTTSGTKFIPISKESMPYHIKCAKDAILNYIHRTGNTSSVKGGTIFIQGSPKLDFSESIPIGRLSGITAHYVPWYLKRNNLPSKKTNLNNDWEKKIDLIIKETKNKNMSLISGIPPWVQMYFEKLTKLKKKNVSKIFPNFSLFVYGGVNFKPYKEVFNRLIGKDVDSVETYPSSEGFIGYQDCEKEGLLLCLDHGIFYEFIEVSKYLKGDFDRISLKNVKINTDYVIILNTNAGLWGYKIGDTVSFVSTKPYRILVTGRIKHFTSAFGEHVIGSEVNYAISKAVKKNNAKIIEFHVAPQVNPNSGLPFHEWFIEFDVMPVCLLEFAKDLDGFMCKQNSYYNDLIEGNVLRPLVISCVEKNGFKNYMKSIGKLGGQNKLPRLSNNRLIADKLHLL